MENREMSGGDKKQPRKYVLRFGGSAEDDCSLADKARCKAFWEFVDSQPHLQSLIKRGEPIFTTAEPAEINQKSQKVVKVKVKDEVKVKNSTSTLADYDDYEDRRKIEEEKRILLRTRRQEQRMRIAKQREKTLELERKSGQIRPKARTMEKKLPSFIKVLSDISESPESAIKTAYQEMSNYDEIKNVHKNPSKSKSNTLSQISELDSDQEQENIASTILGNGDAGSFEIKEIFLKNSDKNNSTEK